MARHPEYLEFARDDRDEVLSRMEGLAQERSGWMMLQPGFDEADSPPPRAGVLAVFSSAGPSVPICSWVPGRRRRNGALDPISIGIEHGSGPRVVGTLASLGVPVPEGWRVVQDQPKRGLVIVLPMADRHDLALEWLVRAGVALSKVPLSGQWRATIYTR